MRFGEFEILSRRPIAGGGFDALARDSDGKEVRLWAGAEGAEADLRAEPAEVARALAKVYHSTLPRVLSSGSADGRAYLAVQAYRGETLAERLERLPLEVTEALDVTRRVAAGLVKAHRAGVVHGCVTAREIVLAEDGRTLLVHLGLGPFLGLRPRRAPEDGASGARSDASDVFGLSRVLLECLLGTDPVRLDGPTGVRPPTEDSLPRQFPEGLRRFLARAVSPDRARRIHRAEEFAGDLGVIRASWDSLTAPSPPGTVVRGALPRWPLIAGVAALALGMVLIARSCAP